MHELFIKSIASVFFIGYIPYASGSFCSLFCTFLIFLFTPPVLWQVLLIVITLIIGTWASYEGERIWGKDNRRIVIDEFAGMLIAMFIIPVDFTNLCLAFLFFRFYDIVKPFPIRYIEGSLQNGLGVMLDDVVAGIMANLTLRVVILIT